MDKNTLLQEKERANTIINQLSEEYRILKSRLADGYYGGWKGAYIDYERINLICQQMLEKEMQAREQQEHIEQLEKSVNESPELDFILCECGIKNLLSSRFCYTCGKALKS